MVPASLGEQIDLAMALLIRFGLQANAAGAGKVLEVSGNCDSKGAAQTRKAVEAAMNAMALPPGYSWSFGSAFENENATQQELLVNLLLALFLVYVVMAALFESLAIIEYLDETHPEPPLLPKTPADRALVREATARRAQEPRAPPSATGRSGTSTGTPRASSPNQNWSDAPARSRRPKSP